MQLKRSNNTLLNILASAAAGVVAAPAAHADEGDLQLDSAVLYYQETGGRVQVVEPTALFSADFGGEHILSVHGTYDSLSGASPTGAVPSDQPQTFTTASGSFTSAASATRPTGVSIAAASSSGSEDGEDGGGASKTYTVSPNTIPMDPSFQDRRGAINLGWQQPLTQRLKLASTLGYSSESDFKSLTGSLSLAQDLNQRDTTLSMGLSHESDTSAPHSGLPGPLSVVGSGPAWSSRGKSVDDVLVGITQVWTRRWLMQANLSYGKSRGYQNDPYKMISVVDAVSGEPLDEYYESRPDTRNRSSFYLENKIHLGADVIELDGRAYQDSWGIHSLTAELRYRSQLGVHAYLEPGLRWYSQTAADFYRYFLVGGAVVPTYASADPRLAAFDATTVSLKFGYRYTSGSEFSVRADYYAQQGNNHPAQAIGQLRSQDLFAATRAVSFILSYSHPF